MINSGLLFIPKTFLNVITLLVLLSFMSCRSEKDGTGKPILVIADVKKNPFSLYTTEILLAEGLNEFDVAELADITSRSIENYDVILLGEVPVTSSHALILKEWIKDGGTFIAFRPDTKLHELCGIRQAEKKTISDKYIVVDTNTALCSGITHESMQYHGAADMYELQAAKSIATIYSSDTTSSGYPAVTVNSIGRGYAYVFSYDLSRSIVYTRQGNPLWAGQKRDEMDGPIRSDDLFYGNASHDLQPDYIDFRKISIPQADEQQRLLANIVIENSRTPIPRFWYLPKNLKAAIVMTGDDHNRNGTPARFEQYSKTNSEASRNLSDWNGVHATAYISHANRMSEEQAKSYEDQGFEIALHLSTECQNWTPKTLDDEWVFQLNKFEEKYSALNKPITNRTHCMCWSDWATQAKVQAMHGVRLDLNYYYWPGKWIQNRPGVFTGSGFPMRFADLDGSIIDCYQAVTQLTDESEINYTTFINRLLDKALGPEGYYGTFVANMHVDEVDNPGSDIIIAEAKKRNVPVISAKQLLTWLDGRNNSSFKLNRWDNGRLNFGIYAASGSDHMNAMLPVFFQEKKLTAIYRKGSKIDYSSELVKGIEYAFFQGKTGDYTAVYNDDIEAPLIKDVVFKPGFDGYATIQWKTNELSDSRVDYGESALTINTTAQNLLPTTNHEIKLEGLKQGATYFVRISSRDHAGNVSIEKNLDEFPAGFAMPGKIVLSHDEFRKFQIGEMENTHISPNNTGQVMLQPLEFQHFVDDNFLSEANVVREKNGVAKIRENQLELNGASTQSTTTFAPGVALEFEATFGQEAKQFIGFTAHSEKKSIVIGIGTTDSLNGVYATAGDKVQHLLIYSNEYGKSHQYRIEWKASRFVFYVDGTEAATIERLVTDSMQLQFIDASMSKIPLAVKWYEIAPFKTTKGSYYSSITDAGSVRYFDMIAWDVQTAPGTSVKVFCRTGNTPLPNKSWTEFKEVANNIDPGFRARYVQYRVDLATNDLNFSPVFKRIRMSVSERK